MTPQTAKLTALIIFIATYAGMIIFSKKRPYIALCAAIVFIILGIVPISGVVSSINWNVLMMLAGTMGTVALFIDSRMPNLMADKLLGITPNIMWAAVVLSLFAGVVSAFIDNVATVLMIAPVGIAIAKRLGISPVPLLISISVSSNLQGAATLVGDTTSIMLGGYAGMDFADFFVFHEKPSIFWAVELGALATIPVIMFIFRKNKHRISVDTISTVNDYFPSVLLVLNVLLLIIVSFFKNKPELTNGIICIVICAVGILKSLLATKNSKGMVSALKGIDYETIILLAGLFVVIGGITNVGIIDDIAGIFVRLGGSSVFAMYTLIVFGSVLFSAFIDNIPYVATMLPVVQGIAALMGCSPVLMYFGLLTGATLGGNITPIGASANIVTIGMLRKQGYEIKSSDFMKIGVPFTLVAVLAGYIFCWIVWH